MGGGRKEENKRTIAGHEHTQLKEEHRLHHFSPDLTVTQTFAPLLNGTFRGKGQKTSRGSICLTKTSHISMEKNPSRTGIIAVVVLTAAHSSEHCSASESCAGVDCPLLPLPESAEVKLCWLCPLILMTLARWYSPSDTFLSFSSQPLRNVYTERS